MLADLTAMQLYCLQIGRLAEAGQLTPTVAGLAKMHNTRKARVITAEVRDMLCGNGILLDYQVIRHMADMEAIHTSEGTETMQTLTSAAPSPASGRSPDDPASRPARTSSNPVEPANRRWLASSAASQPLARRALPCAR